MQSKKGGGQPKPKQLLPYEDNILSDDEDYKNLDDVEPNLDNLDFKTIGLKITKEFW